jgi:septal ring factor EnvC (AmiA/AmiB activator)
MNNENNNIAIEMQHPELDLDIVDRLLTKPPLHILTNMDLCEAAKDIRELRASLKSAHAVATAFATTIQELEYENKELHEMVDDLTALNEGVEADNDTLRKEIQRLKEEREANANNNLFRSTDMS